MGLFATLSIIPLSITVTSAVMVSVEYAECRCSKCLYAECRCSKCLYAECRFAIKNAKLNGLVW